MPATTTPLCSAAEIDAIETAIEASVATLRSRLEQIKGCYPAFDAWEEILTRPGKRVRPQLLVGAYKLFARSPIEADAPTGVIQIAAAFELFHAFLLIHDDVIDRSISRRGKPTLHKLLEAHHGTRQRNAESHAIVVGDIVHGLVYELIASAELPIQIKLDLVQAMARVAQETGFGEALELSLWDRDADDIDEETILRVYELKTAIYTLEAPVWFGAIAAGNVPAAWHDFSKALRAAGIAFQLENDLHEIELSARSQGDLLYDLQCGVKTLFVIKLVRHLSREEDRIFFKNCLSGGIDPRLHSERLARIIDAPSCRAEVRSLITDYSRKASQFLATHTQQAQEDSVTAGLLKLLDFVTHNRKHSEAAHRSEDPSVGSTPS